VVIGVEVTGRLRSTSFVEGAAWWATVRHASTTKEVGTKAEWIHAVQAKRWLIVMGHRSRWVLVRVCMFLSAFTFLATILREERVAVALLLKAGKEVPKGSGLIHVSN
jgi:hypothetical protein